MQFTVYEINGDPLSATSLIVGASATAVVVDANGALEPNSTGTGAQFTIDGVEFTSSANPDYAATGTAVEVYSATVPGQGQVTFAYITSSTDGVDDAIDRIVVLSGTLNTGDVLRGIRLIDGNSTVPYDTIPSVICFTPGCFITTPRGPCLVENLKVGDLVITADNGLQAIRWIGRKPITGARLQAYPELRPVLIRKDAFGAGCPNRDMHVSPQHRMMVSSSRTLLDYGESEVLAPAKGLVNNASVLVDFQLHSTEYIHILFDRHEIVFANGTPTESFHPGHMAMSSVDQNAREELFEIFPELEHQPLEYGPSARLSLKVKEVESLQKQNFAMTG